MTEIQQSNVGANGLVFAERIAEMERHNPAVFFAKYGPVSLMALFERGLFRHDVENITPFMEVDNAGANLV